ncbi:hypothetical protein ACGF0D_17270 [Kitasatospora sp. NPDC048298]|uniref:TRADD-N-associated membrane domain-containing protein n=1 Tax=Kitasatospora sp. NPDC048298 TaxID=3364049 RepID=UPI003720E71F
MNLSDWPALASTLTVSVGLVVGGVLIAWKGLGGSYTRSVEENRDRLRRELRITAGDSAITLPNPVSGAELVTPVDAEHPTSVTHNRNHYEIHVHQAALEEQRAEREEQTFTVLLADYYAHGLAQAQRSSMVSLVASVFGGIVLFVGISLAVWKSETTGGLYAAVVTNVSGLVTGAIGVLFHRQGRLALQHMEGQAQHLRLDMRTERGFRQAVRLVDQVEDPGLKAQLQAALILQFSGAALPDIKP